MTLQGRICGPARGRGVWGVPSKQGGSSAADGLRVRGKRRLQAPGGDGRRSIGSRGGSRGQRPLTMAPGTKKAGIVPAFFVPGAGVEPAQPLQPLVFETSASTDSAIRAFDSGGKGKHSFHFLQKARLSGTDPIMLITCEILPESRYL